MIYDIKLKIRYDYTGAAAGGRQLVRVTPLDVPGRQRVVASLIEIAPDPAERRSWRDFFDNPTVEFALGGAHDHVDLTLKARVERFPSDGWLPLSIRWSDMPKELGTCRDLGARSPLHFVAPSVRVPHLPRIADYAAGICNGLDSDVTCQQVVLAIGNALHRDIRFDARATTVDTPVAEAFAKRRGVCQDMSHIMIAALRSLGIPAGYVSGFLRTLPPPGKPRLEGADAMHAWVRAWCGPETGWSDFDPTNDCLAGMDHIEVAWGRDYADVSPVKGMLRVAGAQSSRQSVDVIPVSG
ncbi:transglutaminase domain-containing protein [Seohaeicola saemankumensis]|uniref:Transglutaminase domain-containing protein n=1 Tax=Seohaeicola saemankumensis TaxID=481181 RepID=A0ABW3TC13_9RHOB